MKTNSVLFLVTILFFLAGCNFDYKKTASGVYYKIMGTATGPTVQPGEVLKMHVKQIYGDSLLRDTRNFIPQYQLIDSSKMSADAFTIFKQVHIGDSIVFRTPADSTLKRKFPKIKSHYIQTNIKVITILANPRSALKDEEYEKQQLRQKYQPEPRQAP